MPVGRIDTEAALDAFVRQVIDRVVGPFLRRIANLAGIDFGTNSVTGNGTTITAKTVTHRLGTTPLFAIAISGADGLNVATTGRTAADVTFSFRHIDAATWTNTNPFYWLAVV